VSWYHLKGKHLVSTKDWSEEDLRLLFNLASDLKRRLYAGEIYHPLPDKEFYMLFFNDSTRTRHSFETAMTQLGGHAEYVNPGNMRLTLDRVPTGKGESIRDTIEVLSRFGQGVGIRLLTSKVGEIGEANRIIEEFATWSRVPIINMMSDIWHPCQALTDLFTLQEKFGPDLRGKKLTVTWAYSPHLRDWASSQETAALAVRLGMDVAVAQPPEFDLSPEAVDLMKQYSAQGGGKFTMVNDMDEGLRGADVVYPRVWISQDFYQHGKEAELALAGKYHDWTYNRTRRSELTAKGSFLMHCMPIDRENEATSDLIDDPEISILYDEAENRLHVQKALLTAVMGGRP
jgi:ornithine carbamoyltransferase